MCSSVIYLNYSFTNSLTKLLHEVAHVNTILNSLVEMYGIGDAKGN